MKHRDELSTAIKYGDEVQHSTASNKVDSYLGTVAKHNEV